MPWHFIVYISYHVMLKMLYTCSATTLQFHCLKSSLRHELSCNELSRNEMSQNQLSLQRVVTAMSCLARSRRERDVEQRVGHNELSRPFNIGVAQNITSQAWTNDSHSSLAGQTWSLACQTTCSSSKCEIERTQWHVSLLRACCRCHLRTWCKLKTK